MNGFAVYGFYFIFINIFILTDGTQIIDYFVITTVPTNF